MADVSLATLPAATPTTVSPASTTPSGVEGTAEGTTPFAGLLTALAIPAAAPLKALAALPATALAGVASLSIVTALPGADGDVASVETDKDAPLPAAGKDDATGAGLTPDLSAFLALIAPPPQLSARPAATVETGEAAPAAAPTTAAVALPIDLAGPVSPETPSTRKVLATPPSQEARESVIDTPLREAAQGLSPPQATPVAIAPERLAQAFAAVRAMAGRAPEQDGALPSPLVQADPQATRPVPAAPVYTAIAATTPDSASRAIPQTAAAVAAATMPIAMPPVTTPHVAPTASVTTTAVTTGDPVQPSIVPQDAVIAPRLPEAAAPPTTRPAVRPREAAPTATPPPTTAPEILRAAPARARKAADPIRVADVRTDVAPARIDVATTTAPVPLADDAVARQLSIAQDGQWLDSLAKDIAGAGNTNGQLNFRLDPDHLGSLTVQLTQTADGASIRLTASSDAARTILADAQPRLVAEARAQGLNLREATVETRTPAPAPAAPPQSGFTGGNGGGRSDQGAAAQMQQQSQQQRNGNGSQRAPDQPARANPAPRTQTATRSGADLYA